MRMFLELVRKEWRDQRGLLLVALGLTLGLVVGAKLVFGAEFDPEMRARWGMTSCLAVVVVVLAAESIGRDAASGVDGLWGLLPVRREAVWGAKVVAVVAGALVYHAAWVGLELAVRSTEVLDERALRWAPLTLDAVGVALLVAGAAAVLMFAALLRRSLGAALAGVGAVISLPLLVDKLHGHAALWTAVTLDRWTPAELALLGASAFGLASVAAYRLRGVHWMSLRRLAVTGLGLSVVLAPTLGRSAWMASERLEFAVSDPKATIRLVEPSPDGRFLAVWATKGLGIRQAWCRTQSELWAVWVYDREEDTWLDLAAGEFGTHWRTLSTPILFGLTASSWSADGRLATYSVDDPGRATVCRYELFDPSSGERVWVHEGSAGMQAQEEELGVPRWYSWSFDGIERVVRWRDREERFTVSKNVPLAISPEPGVVFYQRERELLRHDMVSGREVVLHVAEAPSPIRPRVSEDGRWLYHRADGAHNVLDARTGRVVLSGVNYHLRRWCREGGRVAIVGDGSCMGVLHEDGRVEWLGGASIGQMVEDGAGFLEWAPTGEIRRLDARGRVVEEITR